MAIALTLATHAGAALLDAAWAQTEPPFAATAADTVPDQALRANTQPPWLPERPIPVAERWETALRLPGRIVSLPLSGLGYLTKHTMITVEETQLIPKVLYWVAVIPQLGVAISPASLGDRTGLGIKARVALPRVKDFLAAEWDGSTLEYSRTRVNARYGPARLEYGYDWRPEDRFYGLGLGSHSGDTTTYASQSQQVRLEISHRWNAAGLPGRLDLGAWLGPRELVTRRGREDDQPSFEERFPALAGVLDRRVEHLVYGGRAALDARRGAPRWSRGARVAVEAQRFDKPVEFLALRTARTAFRFTHLAYEAEGAISFYRDPRTFRLLVRAVDNHPDASGTMLLHDLAVLGGSRGLAGFEPGRFHGVDALAAKLSYLFPIAIRFELDLHVEAGGVYDDLWKGARLWSLERSYGVALRPRLDNAMLGAVGVDWSNETLRFRYSIGGVE